MIKTHLNPDFSKELIIKSLNVCFPNWGNQLNYEWSLERKMCGLSPDIIILENEENELIAGSGVSYRSIVTGKGSVFKIGIMTGSWTLPSARGKGCFSKMIIESANVCKKNQIDFLTAFVTEDNPSYRRLKNAGSYCLPANNYFLNRKNAIKTSKNFKEINPPELKINELVENFNKYAGFYYDNKDFKNQYIDRPNPVKIFEFNNVFYIVEISKIIKLLFVSDIHSIDLEDAINFFSLKYEKNVMYFTSNKYLFPTMAKYLDIKQGFFTILPTSHHDVNEIAEDSNEAHFFNTQLGDKI